LVLQKIRMLL